MAANEYCPNCKTMVRIDKGEMRKVKNGWTWKCPKCREENFTSTSSGDSDVDDSKDNDGLEIQ